MTTKLMGREPCLQTSSSNGLLEGHPMRVRNYDKYFHSDIFFVDDV